MLTQPAAVCHSKEDTETEHRNTTERLREAKATETLQHWSWKNTANSQAIMATGVFYKLGTGGKIGAPSPYDITEKTEL